MAYTTINKSSDHFNSNTHGLVIAPLKTFTTGLSNLIGWGKVREVKPTHIKYMIQQELLVEVIKNIVSNNNGRGRC